MSDNELLIKINADTKGVTEAYANVKSKTEDLNNSLEGIAKISAVAFAALSVQVVESLHAFAGAEEASRELSSSLQNQGLFTTELKDKYREYAEQVQATTGYSAVQVTAAQAVAQTYLGQIPITQNLTNAIADLAAKQKISLPEAATQLGKAIGEGTGMLLRQGLQFAITDTQADRYQKTLDFVALKAGGMAQASNQGLGAVRGLKTAFEDTQIELGERFAPAAELVIKSLTEFLTPAKDASGLMVDLKASLIAVGLALSGVGIALPLVVNGFLAARAAAIALGVGLAPVAIIVAGLAVAVTELALHWKQSTAAITSVAKDMIEFLSKSFSGLMLVIQGALKLNPETIKEGLTEISNSFKKLKDDAVNAWEAIPEAQKKSLEKQNEQKKEFADQAAADRKAGEDEIKAITKAENEVLLLENKNASKDLIDLKKQEIQTLKAIQKTQDDEQVALLNERLGKLRALETAQIKQDEQRNEDFAKEEISAKKQLNATLSAEDTKLSDKESADIKKTSLTQSEANKKVYADKLKTTVKEHNTFLEEQTKYGTAYATINQAINSAEVQGTKQATGDLVQLTQSKNSTLKEIGKIASIANIIIKTAESAMNIYAGFSVIPIIGPELGIAGAAAAVAFGAEQVQTVSAAQTGGIVGGSGYGDKMPYLLEPGELIAPRQNFDEVVNSVAASRGLTEGTTVGSQQNVGIMIGFDGSEASRVITARQIEDKALGTYRGI